MKKIQILGSGCTKCNTLAANAEEAAVMADCQVEIEKVTDISQFVSYGCLSTPGLVVDGTLVSQGKLLKPGQIVKYLESRDS